MRDLQTGYPLYEPDENDNFCVCDEERMCRECTGRYARQMVQAGVIAQEDGAPLMRLGTSDPRDRVEDELMVDAAIADALAARPSIPWTIGRVPGDSLRGTPRKGPGIAAIGNGLYVRTGRRA